MTSAREGTPTDRRPDAWGAMAADWAAQEDRQRPTYEEALRHLRAAPGDRVLDVGCGTGAFLELARDRGAEVSGVDASPGLLAAARERVPGADLHLGEMTDLPFPDGRFDIVTGFNAFFFADVEAAFGEAARVTRSGGLVLAQVWGRPERSDLASAIRALREARTGAPPQPPGPALWEPGILESHLRAAGAEPIAAFDHSYPAIYEDAAMLLRCLFSAGPTRETVAAVGREAAEAAVLDACAANRRSDGSYRLDTEWHYAIGRIR